MKQPPNTAQITNLSQLRDGMKIVILLPGTTIEREAIVHIPVIDPCNGSTTDIRCAWLCYNYDPENEPAMCGCFSPQMFGKNAAWFISCSTPGRLIDSPDRPVITSIRAAERKLIRERCLLIRGMIDSVGAVPAAKEAAHRIVDKVRQNTGLHFLSLSQDNENQISYAESPKDKYNNTTRRRSSLARYIRRKLGVTVAELQDHHMQEFVNAVMSYCDTARFAEIDLNFKILRGKELMQAYCNEVGGNSCMTGSGRQPYVRIYGDNPEKVGLLVYEYANGGGKTREARALLWETDSGERLLDRIYPNQGQHIHDISHWAARHNILLRDGNGASRENCYSPPVGKKMNADKAYVVTLNLPKDLYFPYMDTMHSGVFLPDGRICVSSKSNNIPIVTPEGVVERNCHTNLRSTGGAYGSPVCVKCKAKVDPRSSRASITPSGDYTCEECVKKLEEVCDICGAKTNGTSTPLLSGGACCGSCLKTSKKVSRCSCCGRFDRAKELVRFTAFSDDGAIQATHGWCGRCLAMSGGTICGACNTYVKRDSSCQGCAAREREEAEARARSEAEARARSAVAPQVAAPTAAPATPRPTRPARPARRPVRARGPRS